MALAVNSWLESKDISFRVPLTSLINPPLGVAGKPADIGEEVIREELSPEDDVLEYLDEMEPKPKTPGKRKRFEIIVNTKEQYEDLYDLGFRPDEAARTRQLNDLQHVVEEITYNDVSYPLLNNNFDRLLPLINISFIIALGVTILELTRQRRFPISITLDFIQTVYFGIILLLLASNDIFNLVIVDGYDLGILPNIFRVMMYIGGVTSIIGGIVSFIKTIKKIKN